jgi:para-nitrobenzyl esterase
VRFILLLILGLVISGSVAFKALADSPVVHTQNGDVLGVLQGSVESFKALPFAAPPVGDLRWRPPQDPADWLGVRDGSKFSSVCPQKVPGGGVIGSEDCLYLNVFKPQGAQRLPVILFIHGGHNATGSAGWVGNGVAPFDGSDLAQNGNVVVVTINYRLGALGFIAHPALSKESGYNRSGNYGYMDQIRSLKWVSRNIAAFGGDPNNVTVVGASSGGGGILVMMASPLAEGLFHRGIIHSGQFAAQDIKKAELSGQSFSQKLNCKNAPDELTCMRDKSVGEIIVAMPGGHEGAGAGGGGGSVSGPSHFLPVVDGRILPDFPLEVIRSGKYHHVPLLIGNAAEETSWIYGSESKGIDSEQVYINTVNSNYRTNAAKLLELYPARDYPSPREAYDAISADHWFICPAQKVVQAVSGSQSEFVGRFLYSHILSGPVVGYPHPSPAFFGASHGYDLAFMFGTFGYYLLTPTLDELTLKEKFQKTWADFARSGNPGDFWKRYDATQDNYAIFNIPMSSDTQLRKKCVYWDTYVPAAEVSAAAVENAVKPLEVLEEPLLPPGLSSGGRN